MFKSSCVFYIKATEEKEINFNFYNTGSIIIKANCKDIIYPCGLLCCKKCCFNEYKHKKYIYKNLSFILENKKNNYYKKINLMTNIEKKCFSALTFGKYDLYIYETNKKIYLDSFYISNKKRIITVNVYL